MNNKNINDSRKNLAELIGFGFTSAAGFGIHEVCNRHLYVLPLELKLKNFGVSFAASSSLILGLTFAGLTLCKLVAPDEFQVLKRSNHF